MGTLKIKRFIITRKVTHIYMVENYRARPAMRSYFLSYFLIPFRILEIALCFLCCMLVAISIMDRAKAPMGSIFNTHTSFAPNTLCYGTTTIYDR